MTVIYADSLSITLDGVTVEDLRPNSSTLLDITLDRILYDTAKYSMIFDDMECAITGNFINHFKANTRFLNKIMYQYRKENFPDKRQRRKKRRLEKIQKRKT